MKLRKLGNALDHIDQYLASMDCDTFFAQLGTSIEELKHKVANQTHLNSSYDMVYDGAISSLGDAVFSGTVRSFRIGMNISDVQSQKKPEIYYNNSSETNNISFNQAYAA